MIGVAHQEAEAGCRLAGQPQEQPGGDGDPRSADPREERERLGDADGGRIGQLEVLELAPAAPPPLGEPQERGTDRHQGGDVQQRVLAEELVEEALAERTQERAGDHCYHQQPGQLPLGIAARCDRSRIEASQASSSRTRSLQK